MISFTSKNKVTVPTMLKPEKSNKSKQLDFLSSFKPNYYFLRALGLWPFSIDRNSNGEIKKSKITKLDLLWFIISIHLYILAAVVFFKNSEAFDKKLLLESTIKNIIIYGESTSLALSLIFVVPLIAIDMCNRFKLINILKMVANFDEFVGILIFSFQFLLNTRHFL